MTSSVKPFEKKLTQADVLRLGWTQKMINELLPAPEFKRNTSYPTGSPMKLWLQSDVELVMKSDAFQTYAEKTKSRYERAQEKLKQEMQEKIKEINVHIIHDEKIRQKTLQSKQEWFQSLVKNGDTQNQNAYEADEITQQRWFLAYIRNVLTYHDKYWYQLSYQRDCSEVYHMYRNEVLRYIANAYPQYAEACQRESIEQTTN